MLFSGKAVKFKFLRAGMISVMPIPALCAPIKLHTEHSYKFLLLNLHS